MKVAWPNTKGVCRVQRDCLTCKEPYLAVRSEVMRGRGLYCSHSCHGRTRTGELRKDWKGEDASYSAKHKWVTRNLGQPTGCSACGTTDPTKTYDWSNISGEYHRDLSDWQRLCRSCHMAYDQSTKRGSDSPEAILTEQDVFGVLALWREGFSAARIGELFGVTGSSVKDVVTGRTWGWLTKIKEGGGEK